MYPFNLIAGMALIAIGGFLTGWAASPPDPNRWRAAWIFTGTISVAIFGAVAIVTSV